MKKAATENYYLFLEHDATHELCIVKRTDKGIRLDKTLIFDEIFK